MAIVVGTKRKDLPSIHNSDRVQFQRCRRRWNWNSYLRMGLEPMAEPPKALWFGSGFHFAMEDFHGYKRFPTHKAALWAYARSFGPAERPPEWRSLLVTGEKMLDYYSDSWLPQRQDFETYWIDGVPQVEVDFEIKLPGVSATYGGTFDRIVVDAYGRLWVLDWKTAGKFDSAKWETDPQVSAYTWAASLIYGKRFEGVVMVQFLKTPPEPPKMLKPGKDGLPKFSKDKSQACNYDLYYAALKEAFGYIPDEYSDHLTMLGRQDTPEGDNFIRWDFIRRNWDFCDAERNKLVLIAKDMLNKKLPMYPNPTRDCSWDCPFRVPCIAMDDGSDYEEILRSNYMPRREITGWRKKLVYPGEPNYLPPEEAVATAANDDWDVDEFAALLTQ